MILDTFTNGEQKDFLSVDGSIGVYTIRAHRCYSVRKYGVGQVYTSYQQQKIFYEFSNYLHRNKTTPYHPFTTVYSLNSPFTTHPSKIPLFHSHNPGFLPLKSAFSTWNSYSLPNACESATSYFSNGRGWLIGWWRRRDWVLG